MSRFRIAGLLLLACALLTACTGGKPEQVPLYSGDQGVVASFPASNSLRQYSQDKFSIAVRLENMGAADVGVAEDGVNRLRLAPNTVGYVSALYDPSAFLFEGATSPLGSAHNGDPAFIPFSVAGRALYVPQGEVTYADFTFTALPLLGNRASAKSSITFQVCYPYNTTFIQPACIDRDYYNLQVNKVCSNHDIIDTSQGAPLAVTRVEPRFTRDGNTVQPQFLVTIQNLQNGFPYLRAPETTSKSSTATLDICASNFDEQDRLRDYFGKVYVTGSIGSAPLICGSDSTGVARFENRQAQILCRLEQPVAQGYEVGANFESPLIIQVHYIYISSLTASIDVVKEADLR